jgi:hypothetical protein
MALADILLVPGLAALWTAWEKLHLPVCLPEQGALAVNLSCAFMLARYRRQAAVLPKP